MKRKQKILRNFALAALIVAVIWALTGFPAFTKQQALRWEMRRYGISGPVEILTEKENEVLFAAGDFVGIGSISSYFQQVRAYTSKVEQRQEVNLLYNRYMSLSQMPEFAIVTGATRTGTAEVTFHLQGPVAYTYHRTYHFDWDETYTFTRPLENGAAFFHDLKGHYDKEDVDYSDPEAVARSEVEQSVFRSLFDGLRGHSIEEGSAYSITITIYDDTGAAVATQTQSIT